MNYLKSLNVDTCRPQLTMAKTNHRGGVGRNSQVTSPQRLEIILAEDNSLLSQILNLKLTYIGHAVKCVTNGESAWETLRAQHFDLVISDHDMPKLCGLDLMERMREKNMYQPVILISGDMPPRAEETVKKLAPGGILEKPFSFTDLLLLINSLMSLTKV